ncbi:barstar family protein [Streptomyces sp. ME19-01-6]|uniref:barstar family protein n=1 Tax=Streptomyces sp. ME19-01-6 TaxID=3028686 RepID=UPI0029BD4DA7|nr:barstar family protein [Streptomyces sp. ME19-01-6]MDX3232391.1 barstar family protein [Streptomyces sp. ME19-01-6]
MYRFVEDETEREILTATDVRGFFVEPSLGESQTITAVGSSLRPARVPVLFEDVELQVRDVRGHEIGGYYIGRVEVTDVRDSVSVPGGTDLALSFFGYGSPYPYAREIWQTWAQGPPAESGMWKKLPPEAHDSWLHVVQSAWFRTGHLAKRYGDATTCEIAGADLADIAGFYCELGEAVNGPGGYFGSNPNALGDCLSNSGARRRPPFRLVWRDFETSRRNVGDEELDDVISVLRTYGIEIEYPPSG